MAVSAFDSKILFCGVALWFGYGCGNGSGLDASEVKFDSSTSIAYDMEVSNGEVLASSQVPLTIENAARRQLKYTVGYFNGLAGVGDQSHLRIIPGGAVEIRPGLFRATYRAFMTVSLPRGSFGTQFQRALIVPSGGERNHLVSFFETYGQNSDCLDPSAHSVTVDGHYYYYRPERRGCPLGEGSGDMQYASRLQASFRVSSVNSTGKSPEYEKIWEDRGLDAMIIFGMDDENRGNRDVGTQAYNEFYRLLRQNFGLPARSSVNLPFGQSPGVGNPVVTQTWSSLRNGTLTVHAYLIPDIKRPSQEFSADYDRLSGTVDVIAYSGHAGYGSNIRALSSMGRFLTGKYQIFQINGCDTFAYVDDALYRAHGEVNPGSLPTKYVDLITNGMPSYFAANAEASLSLVKGIMDQKNYREILSGFDSRQKANVNGEEDNAWPNPF